MTTVYLVRHAEAEGNIYRRCHGQYDSLLTQRAWKQLPCLAARFASVPLAAVYASDLYRARMTAQAIAEAKHLSVRVRPALREIHMGDWEDCTWAELPLRDPLAYHQWQTQPHSCTVPGGESVLQAGARMLQGVREIVQMHAGEEIAVVTHGSTIRGALCIAMAYQPEQLSEIGWGDNTCVAKLCFTEDGNIDVVYMNDASHLPQELSTFASIGWKDTKGAPASPQIWFRAVNTEDVADRAALLAFAAQKYQSAYGSVAGLDEQAYLADTYAMQQVAKNAVTFGMLEQQPVALVRLNACDTTAPHTGMVGSFVIAPEYQGCGLSQQIIGQAISVYRALDKEYICAYVAVQNARARAFYDKFGFEEQGVIENGLGKHWRMVKRIQVDAYVPETN